MFELAINSKKKNVYLRIVFKLCDIQIAHFRVSEIYASTVIAATHKVWKCVVKLLRIGYEWIEEWMLAIWMCISKYSEENEKGERET